ncbi:MAG: hypothetical protein KGQ67_13685 [Betaproteobacteria bacterium]|nr:hypothetical protein [Betaproteobacteria bacterium]
MTRSPFDRFGGRLPPGLRRPARGPLASLLAAVGAVIAVALGLVFWVTALAVIAVLVVVALGWFWWNTRAVRRSLREAAQAAQAQAEAAARSGGTGRFPGGPGAADWPDARGRWREGVEDARIVSDQERAPPGEGRP